MSGDESLLKDKHILAVDDEKDIIETIMDILDESVIYWARDYQNASKKIKTGKYDLVILDILGVNGLQLLEESVDRGIPAVMLTAHALNPETLIESIQKGAICYLPKAKLAELDDLLIALFSAFNQNEPTWQLLIENLWDYFNERWGPGWQERDREFWSEFCRAYSIGKEIQERCFFKG